METLILAPFKGKYSVNTPEGNIISIDEYKSQNMKRTLKTLEQHNYERLEELKPFEKSAPSFNGIACPSCGKECVDTNPNITLTSYPAQKNIACSDEQCGWSGYRIA